MSKQLDRSRMLIQAKLSEVLKRPKMYKFLKWKKIEMVNNVKIFKNLKLSKMFRN